MSLTSQLNGNSALCNMYEWMRGRMISCVIVQLDDNYYCKGDLSDEGDWHDKSVTRI